MASPSNIPARRTPGADTLWKSFEHSFRRFLQKQRDNIITDISEQNLCGHLAMEIHTDLNRPEWKGYYVDTEYNRKQRGQVKTILNDALQIVPIRCDLIVHSRGQIPQQDNLIAVEMKKHRHPKEIVDKDRDRLIALTRNSFDGVWSADGKTLPEHVCGYLLGLLVTIDTRDGSAIVDEYRSGKLINMHSF